MSRTLLIIAYQFPPDGGGGTQRAAKFCRYLPEFGWRPIVLTRESPAERRGRWTPEDATLLREVEHVQVERVPSSPSEPAVPMFCGPGASDHPWVARAALRSSGWWPSTASTRRW